MKRLYSNGLTFSAAVAVLGLAACSGSGTSPKNVTTANVSANTLQLNVGTANLFGTGSGTNVVVTYRQPSGQSGTLVNGPTLTFPRGIVGTAGTPDGFDSTIVTGPAPSELTTTSAGFTTQTGSATTTFGISGGAFGVGLEPFNYGSSGTPDNIAPYQVPLYDGTAADTNAFLPLGGLPAFDPSGNAAAVDAGVNGVSEGLDVFNRAPAVGTYTLAVTVPGAAGASATASITSAALLPTVVSPLPVLAAGAVSFAYVQPAGATESYIQVMDVGPITADATSCVGATTDTPVYYTIAVKASGTATLPSGDICTAAANTMTTGSASSGDAFTVQAIAFDYPAYEMSYPNSLGNAAPSIVGLGATRQADLSISPRVIYNLPVGGGAPIVNTALPSGVTRFLGRARQ